MFDLADDDEENLRSEWYAPIGEYVLLFSNLEFMLSSWIRLLSASRAIRNIESTLQFSKRIELLFNLIEEYEVDKITKEKWRHEWEKVKPLMITRNLICHNPPINNFSFSLDKGHVSLELRAIEILVLKKPIGEPGSGLSLAKLKKQAGILRQLLICLDELDTEESLRFNQSAK